MVSNKIFFVLILATLTGCVSMGLTSPEGYHASYTRLGGQEIKGLRFEKDELGVVRVYLDQQKSDSDAIMSAIRALVGGAK